MTYCTNLEKADKNIAYIAIGQEITPPKFNMEPENHTLEKEKHLPNNHFWVGFREVQPS